MLDALPPPAIVEEAPSWVRTQDALHPVYKAVLPGLVPFLGGSYGVTKIPPAPSPIDYQSAWNIAAVTGAQTNANSINVSTVKAGSRIVIMHCGRTAGGPADSNPYSVVLGDNQGGTYVQVGGQQAWYQGANQFFQTLWVRTTPTTAGTFTPWATHTTASTGLWHTGLVVEIENPNGYSTASFKYEGAHDVSQGTGTVDTGTHDKPFSIDFVSQQGALSASANSGFTNYYQGAGFVSNNVRLSLNISGYRAQAAARTYTVVNGGALSTFSCWWETARSSPKMRWQNTDRGNTTVASLTPTITGLSIGSPAPDRQVVVVAASNLGTAANHHITGLSSSGVVWDRVIPTAAAFMPATIFRAHVPAGTTIDLAFTTSVSATIYAQVYVVAGAEVMNINQVAALNGEATPGYRLTQSNSANSPQSQTLHFLPKGSVDLGAAATRGGNAPGLTGDWSTPAGGSSVGAGTAQAPGARENVSGSDETTKTYGIGYTGTVPINIVTATFGP